MKLGGAYNAGPLAVNRWVATKAGKVSQVLVENGQPVEFDQPLVIVE